MRIDLEMNRINYSFYILVLSALAVNSIIVALLTKALPLFTSRISFLCQKFIASTMVEIPHSLPNALIIITGIILGAGLLSFLLQLGKTHILLRKLLINRIDIPKELKEIIESLGLTNKVILIMDNNLFSFCCGIFSPYIVITTNLIKTLTDKELEAVLLHEQSHLVNRDPIKVLIGKTFSSMYFFLPIFSELHKNTEAVNELLADQWTTNYQQKTIFLRSALKKILAAPQLNLAIVPNVSGPDYFEIRIHRLVNPGVKHKLRPSLASLVTTFLFIISSLFLLQTPVDAFHMDTQPNSAYFLCTMDRSCSAKCHNYLEESNTYIPAHSSSPAINYSLL